MSVLDFNFSGAGSILICGNTKFPPGFEQREFEGAVGAWDLHLTLSGKAIQHLPQGDDVEGPHDLVLLKPDATHAWQVPDNATEPWVVVWFVFRADPDMLPLLDLPEVYPLYSRLQLAGSPYAGKIRRAFLQAHRLAHHPTWPLAMHAIKQALLWLRLELSSREASSDRRVQTAMEIIYRRIAKPPSLPELAKACGVSVSRLGELFLEDCGQTPRHWQEQARMAHAQNLLAHSQLSVKQVADSCGYVDQRHFATRFRKLFGLTPLEHRRRAIALRHT